MNYANFANNLILRLSVMKGFGFSSPSSGGVGFNENSLNVRPSGDVNSGLLSRMDGLITDCVNSSVSPKFKGSASDLQHLEGDATANFDTTLARAFKERMLNSNSINQESQIDLFMDSIAEGKFSQGAKALQAGARVSDKQLTSDFTSAAMGAVGDALSDGPFKAISAESTADVGDLLAAQSKKTTGEVYASTTGFSMATIETAAEAVAGAAQDVSSERSFTETLGQKVDNQGPGTNVGR